MTRVHKPPSRKQPSIGYQAVIIKGDIDAIGVLGW